MQRPLVLLNVAVGSGNFPANFPATFPGSPRNATAADLTFLWAGAGFRMTLPFMTQHHQYTSYDMVPLVDHMTLPVVIISIPYDLASYDNYR